jgi:peptidoglycan-associated lipoprotein
MKSIGWKLLTCMALVLVVFLVTGCGKKQISSEPYGTESAEEARRRAEEEAQRKSKAGIGEEDLQSAKQREEQARMMQSEGRKAFENEDIYFDYDSAALTPAAQEILRKKAAWLQENPGAKITIEGHCDERGTNEYNLALGEARAQSARNYLVDLGVSAALLNTISFGEERPLDPRATEEAWAKNRRVHFVITP